MTPLEISTLRTHGQLEDAYRGAIEALQEDPGSIVLKRELGWILSDQIKTLAGEHIDHAPLLAKLQEFIDAEIRKEEQALYISIVWNIRSAVATYIGGQQENYVFMEQLADALEGLQLPEGERVQQAISALAGSVMRYQQSWEGMGRLLHWCGLNRLKADDYQPFAGQYGTIMSVAEKMDIRIARYYLQQDAETIGSFVEEQRAFTEAHPDYTYPAFYLAKLLLASGDLAGARDVLRGFARHKAGDFWVWQLLGDAHECAEERLAFYSKAMLCGGQENMKVGLYESFALLLAETGDYDHARWMTQQSVRIRQQNGWNPTNALKELLHQPWLQGAAAAADRRWLEEKALPAEEFLFGELHEYEVLVTHVNQERGMVSFVTEERRESFFRWGRNGRMPQEGDVLRIRCTEIPAEGPTQVRRRNFVHERTNPHFFRHFSGALRMIGANGLAGHVFIPSQLLGNRQAGASVSGQAMLHYNRARREWDFRAIRID